MATTMTMMHATFMAITANLPAAGYDPQRADRSLGKPARPESANIAS